MDMPYGLGHQAWDKKKWTGADIVLILQSVLVSTKHNDHLPVAVWFPLNMHNMLYDSFQTTGFLNMEVIVWHKPGQNHHGPPFHFIPGTEFAWWAITKARGLMARN